MRELTLNDQVVVFDREATAAVYRNIDVLGTDVCTCNSCKNFRQFRHVAYGPKLLDLLDRLGIDPLKEWEVYWAGEDHLAKGYIS
jgi:hypothetical protein